MAKYAKALVALAVLIVYGIAGALGLDLGEVPGVEVDIDLIVQGLVATFLVYLVPNKDVPNKDDS